MPWIFMRLRGKEVLNVAVAIVRGDAAGVPQGGSGLVALGVLGQELTFSQGLVKLSNQDRGSGRRESGDET